MFSDSPILPLAISFIYFRYLAIIPDLKKPFTFMLLISTLCLPEVFHSYIDRSYLTALFLIRIISFHFVLHFFCLAHDICPACRRLEFKSGKWLSIILEQKKWNFILVCLIIFIIKRTQWRFRLFISTRRQKSTYLHPN